MTLRRTRTDVIGGLVIPSRLPQMRFAAQDAYHGGLMCLTCRRPVTREEIVEGEPGKKTGIKVLVECWWSTHTGSHQETFEYDWGTVEWAWADFRNIINRWRFFDPQKAHEDAFRAAMATAKPKDPVPDCYHNLDGRARDANDGIPINAHDEAWALVKAECRECHNVMTSKMHSDADCASLECKACQRFTCNVRAVWNFGSQLWEKPEHEAIRPIGLLYDASGSPIITNDDPIQDGGS